MVLINHHHHTIVSTPVYDDETGKWKLSASVTWPQIGNARGVRFLTGSPELFNRFEDAEQAGLEAGKNWIENGHKEASRAESPMPSYTKKPLKGSFV
jgi:hypothetical protein